MIFFINGNWLIHLPHFSSHRWKFGVAALRKFVKLVRFFQNWRLYGEKQERKNLLCGLRLEESQRSKKISFTPQQRKIMKIRSKCGSVWSWLFFCNIQYYFRIYIYISKKKHRSENIMDIWYFYYINKNAYCNATSLKEKVVTLRCSNGCL